MTLQNLLAQALVLTGVVKLNGVVKTVVLQTLHFVLLEQFPDLNQAYLPLSLLAESVAEPGSYIDVFGFFENDQSGWVTVGY